MIDTLIGLFVATVLATAFTSGMLKAVQISSAHTKDLQAELLAVELIEIARDLEQTSLVNPFSACSSACSTGTTGSPPVWELVSGDETINGYTRSLQVSSVYRDSVTHEIAPTGVLDPDTQKLTATVAWMTLGNAKSIQLESYAYDFYGNW